MPFGQRLDQLIGKVKDQVDKYSNEHGQQQQHQQPQQSGYPGTTPYNRPPPPPPQQPVGPGPPPTPYWRANFDPSTPVDAQFKHQTGDWGWGNNELQNYTPSPANSYHRGDHKLVLRAIANAGGPEHQKYTSARLTSHQTLGRQRGCLEVVLTPPIARGVWPAFWLLPREPFQWPNEGEVDIFESWNADTINHSCLHWGHFNGEDSQKHRALETHMPHMGRPEGHRFALAWQQPEDGNGGRLVWYIDGRPVMRAGIPPGTRRISDWQIIINVAMGGNVCQGVMPADGAYEFVIHELQMLEAPRDGWGGFEGHWNAAAEGHAM